MVAAAAAPVVAAVGVVVRVGAAVVVVAVVVVRVGAAVVVIGAGVAAVVMVRVGAAVARALVEILPMARLVTPPLSHPLARPVRAR